jgi:hypothetical protein
MLRSLIDIFQLKPSHCFHIQGICDACSWLQIYSHFRRIFASVLNIGVTVLIINMARTYDIATDRRLEKFA